MSEIGTESSHARCELCRMLKTVRMIEHSANKREFITLLTTIITSETTGVLSTPFALLSTSKQVWFRGREGILRGKRRSHEVGALSFLDRFHSDSSDRGSLEFTCSGASGNSVQRTLDVRQGQKRQRVNS